MPVSDFDAIPVKNASEIRQKLADDTTVVAIDEAQFLDEEIIPLVGELADRGLRVIVAGLDQDFRGEPFGPMPSLMALAEGRLQNCTPSALSAAGWPLRTQRLVNGKTGQNTMTRWSLSAPMKCTKPAAVNTTRLPGKKQ